jgi:hypothetical protein
VVGYRHALAFHRFEIPVFLAILQGVRPRQGLIKPTQETGDPIAIALTDDVFLSEAAQENLARHRTWTELGFGSSWGSPEQWKTYRRDDDHAHSFGFTGVISVRNFRKAFRFMS